MFRPQNTYLIEETAPEEMGELFTRSLNFEEWYHEHIGRGGDIVMMTEFKLRESKKLMFTELEKSQGTKNTHTVSTGIIARSDIPYRI